MLWNYRFDVDGILQSVEVADVDKCTRWAFGPELCGSTPMHKLNDMWNERHGDIFILADSDEFLGGIERIGKAWLDNIATA
jgi:hypothetical protein